MENPGEVAVRDNAIGQAAFGRLVECMASTKWKGAMSLRECKAVCRLLLLCRQWQLIVAGLRIKLESQFIGIKDDILESNRLVLGHIALQANPLR